MRLDFYYCEFILTHISLSIHLSLPHLEVQLPIRFPLQNRDLYICFVIFLMKINQYIIGNKLQGLIITFFTNDSIVTIISYLDIYLILIIYIGYFS